VPITWSQALAWRLRRQLLDPIGTQSVEGVVRRLGAVQAQVSASAELAIRLRRRRSTPGEVTQALADGRIIKVWIMRGAMHLVTPEEGGAYLSMKAENRQWELPSWQSFYGMAPDDWEPLRAAVREALADRPLTPGELGAAITVLPRFRHLGFAFVRHWGTFLKPLFWQGVMSFGPTRDASPTFQRLDDNPRWAGLPEPDEAGRRVVESYFRAYGPATIDNVRHWTEAGGKRVGSWMASLGDHVVDVELDGTRAFVLREDLRELAETSQTVAVRLLPGYDQWVMGPGTADRHIVPPARRSLLSRQAPFVVAGGVVSGTWALSDDQITVDWFAEAGRWPLRALDEEVARLATIMDRQLELEVQKAPTR
jgi:hypothetical protein